VVATAPKLDTREVILDACDRLMGRYGFRKMTVDHLAREAGISKRTVYLYFRSKEEIGLSSIDRVVARTLDEMRNIAGSGGDPIEKLRQMLMTRVLFRIDSVQAYADSLDGLFEAVRPAYMTRRKMYFEAESVVIEAVLAEGQASKHFCVHDLRGIAQTLLRATNAFLPYSLAVSEIGARHEIESRLGTMVDLLLRGLTNKTEEKLDAKETD
jgi:AcrR family transcriptional regulator